MADIYVEFNRYMPNLSTFYAFFEILKEYRYIENVEVIHENSEEKYLRISRNSPPLYQ